MKLAEAYVEITARTGKFMRALGGIKRALGNVMRVAAKMALAVVAAFAAVTIAAWKFAKVAMVQERAEMLLDAALKATGHSVAKYGKELRKAASEIQKVTTFGDEFLLSLMATGINLGVSADKIEEVTKLAIGLAVALKMDLATSMRYTTLATMGETTMLGRYIPALRGVTDATEKFNIVQKVALAGFQQAQADTKTTTGALEQLKNMLGDVAEMIGKKLLKPIKAMTQWFLDNTDAIKKWVDKATVHIERFAKTLKNFWEETDWMGKWKSITSAILELLKGFVKAAVILAVAAGKGIWQGIKEGILDAGKERVNVAAMAGFKERGGTLRFTQEEGETRKTLKRSDEALFQEELAKAQAAEMERVVEPIFGPAFSQAADEIGKGAAEARKAMTKNLSPEGIRKQMLIDWQATTKLMGISFKDAMSGPKKSLDWLRGFLGGPTKTAPLDIGAAFANFSSMFGKVWEKFITPWVKVLTGPAKKTKEEERKKPEFIGLAEAWKRVQLAVRGGVSPEVVQQQQLKTQKKQTTVLQSMKKTAEKSLSWLQKLVEKPATVAALQ